jgi:hypothetical protein
MANLDKETLIEASYRISEKIFEKVPRTRTIGYIKGYSKAGKIAHEVLKEMIDESR